MIKSFKICVAIDNQGGFAKDNQIPWNIPEDFKHFINTTRHSWCITGKNSYLEMVEMKKNRLGDKYDPEAPILKDRITFVVSSTLEAEGPADAVLIRPDEIEKLVTTLEEMEEERDVFILGGQQLYEDMLDRVDTIIVTLIPHNFNCDRFFPTNRFDEFTQTDEWFMPTEQYGDEHISVRVLERK